MATRRRNAPETVSEELPTTDVDAQPAQEAKTTSARRPQRSIPRQTEPKPEQNGDDHADENGDEGKPAPAPSSALKARPAKVSAARPAITSSAPSRPSIKRFAPSITTSAAKAKKDLDPVERVITQTKKNLSGTNKIVMDQLKTRIQEDSTILDYYKAINEIYADIHKVALGDEAIMQGNEELISLLFESGLNLGTIFKKDDKNRVSDSEEPLEISFITSIVAGEEEGDRTFYMTKGFISAMSDIILRNNGTETKKPGAKADAKVVKKYYEIDARFHKLFTPTIAAIRSDAKKETKQIDLTCTDKASMTKMLMKHVTIPDAEKCLEDDAENYNNIRKLCNDDWEAIDICHGGPAALKKQAEKDAKKTAAK